MGGGKKSKAPATPDYSALAAQEAESSKEIAQGLTRANRPNQYDAFGNSLTWSEGPNNTWTQNINMNPQMKAQWDRYLGDQNIFRNILSDKMSIAAYNQVGGFRPDDVNQYTNGSVPSPNSWGGLNDYGVTGVGQGMTQTGVGLNDYHVTGINNANAYSGVRAGDYGANGIDPSIAWDQPKYDQNSGKAVADALYGSVMDRGRVEQQRETDTLTTQLRQQGLQPGTQAFDRAMQNLRTSQNDANLLAAQNATLAGGQEARDIYGAQLAGNQQRFNQFQGTNATNLQNAAFAEQQNTNRVNNLMGIQSNNLNNAMFANQQNQQNFQNRLSADANNRNNFFAGMQSADQAFNQNTEYANQQRANYEAYLKGNAQQFGQGLSEYNQYQQDLSWLQAMGGSPMAPQFASFGTASGYDPAQLMSAANATYGANMSKYNSSNSKKGGLLGSGMGLGGSLLGNK